MTRFVAAAFVSFSILSCSVKASDQPEKTATALPRVPSRALIAKDLKDGEVESKRVTDWVQVFIAAREKKARAELEVLKVKMKSEETERDTADKERKRREERQNQRWGTLGPRTATTDARKGGVRIKLDFLVPEVETYRNAVEIYRIHQALANDIVETLSKLDRDSDGRLTVDEYRDVGALISSTTRLSQNLDRNGDGMISEGELEQMQNVPASAAAAIRNGRISEEGLQTLRIKVWDADANGELDVSERKALSMNFVNQSLRAADSAAFYKYVADTLASARDNVAVKFAELEILP